MKAFSSCFSSTWNDQSRSCNTADPNPNQADQTDRLPGSVTGCDWPAGCSDGWGSLRWSCSAGSGSPSTGQVNWSKSRAATGTCRNHPPHHGNRQGQETHVTDCNMQHVAHLHRSSAEGASQRSGNSPPPAGQRSPSLDLTLFSFNLSFTNISVRVSNTGCACCQLLHQR